METKSQRIKKALKLGMSVKEIMDELDVTYLEVMQVKRKVEANETGR